MKNQGAELEGESGKIELEVSGNVFTQNNVNHCVGDGQRVVCCWAVEQAGGRDDCLHWRWCSYNKCHSMVQVYKPCSPQFARWLRFWSPHVSGCRVDSPGCYGDITYL